MYIEIKYRFGANSYIDGRTISLAFIVLFTSFFLLYLGNLFQSSRESIFPLAKSNQTFSNILFQCRTPYDQCRCSILSNKTNRSMKCITDAEAMTGHILPLVSYVLQFYLIHEFFSFTRDYSCSLSELSEVIAFIVFITIGISVHGSSCSHFYTCMVISITGMFLSGFVFSQLFDRQYQYILCKIYDTFQDQRLSTKKGNREIRITIPVS